jgi:ABC-type sugar transport system permease subunit
MNVLTSARTGARPTAPDTAPARTRQRRGPRQLLTLALFLAPAIVLVAAIMIVPFLNTAYRSLFHDNGFTRTWAGLENYATLLTSPGFGQSLLNTVLWVVGTLALPVLIGLLIAAGTHTLSWGPLARFSLILPYALSGAATAVIWTFMLSSDGAVNGALAALGLDALQQGWLLQWPLNTLVMILASTWQGTGVAVILFLVGLQAIPPSTLEAARLDGADGRKLFWYITLPQLRPITAVVVGISIVNSLKTFDIIWLLTGGGPGGASETLAVTMYQQTFTLSRYGVGAAVAVFLTVIVIAASWVYLRRQLRAS